MFTFIRSQLAPVALVALLMAPLASSITCKVDSKGLKAVFHKVSGANYYEVQIATSASGPPFGAQSSEGKGGYVYIYGALKGTTYYVRLRSHSSSNKFRLRNGWSAPGKWYKCPYPKTLDFGENQTSSTEDGDDDLAWPMLRKSKKVETFNLGLVRGRRPGTFPQNEPFPDYLDERNAAGYKFEISWDNPGSVVTLYCVEILKKTFPKNTIWSYAVTNPTEHFHYANYMNCDLHPGAPPYNPTVEYTCTPTACGGAAAPGSPACNTAQADMLSHVGKAGGGADGKAPKYYSLPEKAECRDHEDVGTKRSDGSICTWKRMSHARFFTAQQKMTVQQMEAKFHTMPLSHWHCGDHHKASSSETLDAEGIVV